MEKLEISPVFVGCCDQENLIAPLAGGVKAIAPPVNNLHSNWAWMVISSLTWTLKAWTALLVPVHPHWKERRESERRGLLTMEFKTFVDAVIKLPCQIVTHARQAVMRVLNGTPGLPRSPACATNCAADPTTAVRETGCRKSRSSGARRPALPLRTQTRKPSNQQFTRQLEPTPANL